MLPVIAIVGRPNVGKSTLFNCLTRRRAALVSPMPGMTRDRQYGEADIADRRFIIIDTGGISHEKNNLDRLMAEQSEQAILEADKIIFLVDGRTELTAADRSIVKKLRALNKNIFLVVNKTEGLDSNVAIADFFQLGLGTPYPISAAHGKGIEELVQTLLPIQEIGNEKEPNATGIKLAIIGRPNVGKSTLINRMLGEDRVIVFDEPGTTRDSIFIPLTRFNKEYTLIDTAGVRQRGKIFETTEKFSVVKTLQAIETTHVVIFVIDAREGVTEQDLRLLGFILESGRALVIAINKWDGMTLEEKDKTRATIDRRLHFVPFVRIHFISALHGSGVGNLFDSVDEAYVSANKKLSTPKLTQILEEAVTQHAPPLVQGRRIKLRYAHSGGNNPPLIIIHGNQVKALPEAYRRYLANTYQARLKLMGTPVRIEVKSSENPFRHKKNVLTTRQKQKKLR
ncbi:MAG TPA: ribosome biogenesis GTPase Der, partial [Gammaproteobacteria bacterium]|nr:ribosome biogenesis GTPase Der [Gammaproteobacteria bacterium]